MSKVFSTIQRMRLRYILLCNFAFLFICALALVSLGEAGLGDAIWWAMATATTVGYGDVAPSSFLGRTVGVLAMLVSTYLVGPLIIAHIVLRFVRDANAWTDAEQRAVQGKLTDLGEAIYVVAQVLSVKTAQQVRDVLDTHEVHE